MERVLVGLDVRKPFWEALDHALCLAERLTVQVHVLMVGPPGGTKAAQAVRGRLLQILQEAEAEGVKVGCFMAEGEYEGEVIDFAARHSISLLVAGPADDRGALPESLARIVNGVQCRVELVSQKIHIRKDTQ